MVGHATASGTSPHQHRGACTSLQLQVQMNGWKTAQRSTAQHSTHHVVQLLRIQSIDHFVHVQQHNTAMKRSSIRTTWYRSSTYTLPQWLISISRSTSAAAKGALFS